MTSRQPSLPPHESIRLTMDMLACPSLFHITRSIMLPSCTNTTLPNTSAKRLSFLRTSKRKKEGRWNFSFMAMKSNCCFYFIIYRQPHAGRMIKHGLTVMLILMN
jgi:hypothetical protein